MAECLNPTFNHPKVNICLATLMGLPASGKTTLCEQLLQKTSFNRDTKLLKLSYDEFIPMEIQSAFPFNKIDEDISNSEGHTNTCPSIAKILRGNFIRMLGHFVSKLKYGISWDPMELEEELSPHANEILHVTNFVSKLKEITDRSNSENLLSYSAVIILIDDNNYYRSMRNELYQVAKSNKVGFCVLYPRTNLQVCQERNADRQNSVPASTIEKMNAKLEELNPLQNPCDMLSLQIADVEDPCTHKVIQSVLEYSLKNPVSIDPPPDRSEEIARERRRCRESEIHLADQVLRKWITTELNLASFRCKNAEKRKLSQELTFKKATAMSLLRSGEVKISADVEDDFGFRKEIVALARSIKLSNSSSANASE